MRFYKNALKTHSALFRALNNRINPAFDSILIRIVTEHEVAESKNHAAAAQSGKDIPEGWNFRKNIKKWNKI